MGQRRAAKPELRVQGVCEEEAGSARGEFRGERGERVGWLIEARCGCRGPPICQQTGRPPSYPKNLVAQCNMAPPQSLQLAVWALFGVVS